MKLSAYPLIIKSLYGFILMLCILLVSGCNPARDQVSILHFAEKGADDEWAKELNANKDWGITRSNSPSVLSEDSLEQISAVVISVSELNKLDHRSVPQLKRYLEAGGGGIV